MKAIVIGCPGSGKSYFSKKLGEKLKIKVYHLDKIFWKENWEPTPLDEFLNKQNEIFLENDYIIDGTYCTTLEERFKNADHIFFLDMPTELCLEQEAQRRGKKRDDLPDYLKEQYDPEFINYIKEFKKTHQTIILEYINRYKDNKKIIIFNNKEDIKNYLNK